MDIKLNEIESSRLHLGVSQALGRNGSKPENKLEATRDAFAVAVAKHAQSSDEPLWRVLQAADKVSNYVFETTGHEVAEFDIPSIEELGFNRPTAVLVARLNGAIPYEDGQHVVWKNAASAPIVKVPCDLIAPMC